jgi:phage-related protein
VTTPAGDSEDYGSARITITLDDTGVIADARLLGARIRAALDRATIGIGARIRGNIERGLRDVSVSVQVNPDLSRFDAQLLNGLRGIDTLNIPVAPNLDQFMTRLRAALADQEVSIRVVPDLDTFDARIRAHRPPDVTVNTNVDSDRFTRALAGLGRIAGSVGGILAKGLAFGAIGIAAAGAAQGVIALTAALAPAVGIIAAGPAVILGYQAALGTLKLALDGVADSFSAALTGDAEAFQKTLEKLSPAAQAAALEVRALKPAFDDLKTSVQDAFFEQITGQITKTAQALQGPLQSGLTRIAAAWGDAAKGVLGYIQGTQGVSNVRAILDATGLSVEGLSQTTNKLTAGILQVAAAVSKAFGAELAGGIANAGQRFGEFLQQAAQGGDAVRWVDQALTVFAQLGDILGNLRTAFSGIANAAAGAGAGVLGTIQQVTQQLSDFVNSTQGQTAIGNLFATVATIGAQLRPILAALVTQLGAIAPALAPVFTALGPAVVGLVNALGPALAAIAPSLQTVAVALADAFGAIGPSLGPLGQAIAQVVTGLAPLLPLAGQLVSVLAQALAPVLSALAQAFAPIISALVSALMPILPPLADAFTTLVTALTPLVTGVGQAVADLFTQLAPALPPIADAIGQVVDAVVPLITQLTGALLPLLPTLTGALLAVFNAVLPLVQPVADLATALSPLVGMVLSLITPLLQAQVGFESWLVLNAVVPIITRIVSALTGLVQGITSVVTFITALPATVSAAFTSLVASVSGAASGIGSFFSSLGTTIGAFFTTTLPNLVVTGFNAVVTFLSALPAQIGALISTGFSAVVTFFTTLPGLILAGLQALPSLIGTVIGTLIGLVLFPFVRLPVLIGQALVSLGSTIAGAFTSAWAAATTAVSSGISATLSFFQQLPGRIGGALAALGSTIAGRFTSAWASARAATSAGISSVVSFVSQLPGRAASALSALGGRLASVFRSAGSAMLSAARSAGSQVTSFFTGLPGRIRGALSGASSALAGVGRDLVRGLISGVRAMAGQVASAAKEVVSSAISAAKNVLKIGSPSKVFIAIGRDTGKGFVIGLTGSAAEIKQTTDKIAADIRDAFKGKKTKLDDTLLKLVADGNKRLTSLANQRDAIAKRIADAQTFATNTAASALQGFSLQNLTQGGVNLFNITEGLDSAVSQVKNFTKQIDSLSKRGLRKDLLQQIIGLGPQQGAQLATFFSDQSASTLKRINSLQSQLVSATNTLGKNAADDLFDAGKQASRGFLAGLKAQEKDIDDLMLKIAKSMQTAIRKALGIKSPSVVFRRIGDQTGQGLQLGLLDRLGALQESTRQAARVVALAATKPLAGLGAQIAGPVVTPTLAAGSGTVPLTRSSRARASDASSVADLIRGARRSPTSSGAAVTNNWNIQAAEDPEKTARIVLRRLAQARLA